MSHTGRSIFNLVVSILVVPISAYTDFRDPSCQKTMDDSLSWGILIPHRATMVRAWEVPRNPMTAQTAENIEVMESVKRGFAIFMNTPKRAPSLTGGSMSCNNCHPNGGQREKALPLVGIDKVFPEYNKRSGRNFTLDERIIGCLLRSVNATGSRDPAILTRHENELGGSSLNSGTRQVRDLAAYITWLSFGIQINKDIPWRGHNSLPTSALLPVDKLNPRLGEKFYNELCSSCHGKDGQGVVLGVVGHGVDLGVGAKRPGPLWGPNSWNDGAGAARTYTLAGMIRNWMPYLNPGILSDEQAQDIAAYITSQRRPSFPYKDKDYLKEKMPVDAVYYTQLYKKNPLSRK